VDIIYDSDWNQNKIRLTIHTQLIQLNAQVTINVIVIYHLHVSAPKGHLQGVRGWWWLFASVCVCVFCMYVRVYIYTHTHTHTYIHIHTYNTFQQRYAYNMFY